MKDLLTDDFYEAATEQLADIANQISQEAVGIIAECIQKMGTMNPAEINRLRHLMRTSDLEKIEKAIAELSEVGLEEIEKIFDEVAKENEVMAQSMYEYREIKQVPYAEHKELNAIVEAATKNAKEEFLNISQTRAFNINGKPTSLSKTYNMVVDKAIFAVSQGTVDYDSAMQKILSEMAKSGIQKVNYESGYSRRLDSSVRMNVIDGCRQMSLSFRETQAKEYGADAWEISAHSLCRPEHQPYQGKVIPFEEFDKLNKRLKTPIATGELNCRHVKTGVIQEINEPAYTKEELEKLKEEANKKIKVISASGNELEKTRYEWSQYLAAVETSIRRMKDEKKAFERAGNTAAVKKKRKEIKDMTTEYKRICKSTQIYERPSRLGK